MAKNSRLLQDLLAEMVLPEVVHHHNAPKMPPDEHTGSIMPCLPFVPRSHRFLETIHPIAHDEFKQALNNYLASLPELAISGREARRFMLPEPGLMAWPHHMKMDDHFRKFSDDVLGCVYSIMNYVDRGVDLHDFGAEKGGAMHCGWTNNNWGLCNPVLHRLTDVKVVTVTMPAWCFAPKDMADFVNMKTFMNPATLMHDSPTVPTAVKLWARLHDFCYLHDAHYFIVSTYEQWAFGAFSDQYSTGFVSSPMNYSASIPTVFEAAMFWMHSAHGHPSGYKVKPVREQPDYVETPVRYSHQAVPHPRAAYYLTCCS
ncbi:hypothetical protein EXIGLDRAFT_759178 [Exidia glandulosa HHB12029]|uniref:Uncharacterized protein n=1 Tax=Exidia glandulosa HHB12029 TaxID=1314781 RepID=A0A165QA51_EXIGL|nr:hypothetical protein EXIGLDRAFT_759178 [Exidia glandulosa HHB12029]